MRFNPFSSGLAKSLSGKLLVLSGGLLLLSMSAISYFAVSTQKEQLMENAIVQADRLSTTIKLGTHYAMMINSREDITHIIKNVGRQPDIRHIRIYNKEGQIKFSNLAGEVDTKTNIRDEACYVCHRSEPPRASLELSERVRMFNSEKGEPLLGILSAIDNEPGCSDNCHFHPKEKNILGAIDIVVSLEKPDRDIWEYERSVVLFILMVFLLTSGAIFAFMFQFVKKPILRLIRETRLIARGETPSNPMPGNSEDEIGQLSEAVAKMGREIGDKQRELNRQRNEYQNLFAHVPCLITVQDKNFRIIRYNREFAEKFKPKPGDYCYHAYKGRNEKCPDCPVQTTFDTGRPTYSEEDGLDKDGNPRHWLVSSSPIRNAAGEITAAMEMSLDITERKKLERELKKSEEKYLAIFNNIPNPVFVLAENDLEILDCNQSVRPVYGFEKPELAGRNFLEFFRPTERESYAKELHSGKDLFDRVVQVGKDGRIIYVTLRLSPSEYGGRKVILVTSSDITKRLETEQQLIQAGKMATLGEMATGVAHELNQPLTVIKSAAGFFLKKFKKGGPVTPEVLVDLAQEVDSQVDRASKIINHLREFGRKPDMRLKEVDAVNTLRKAFDIFSRQLALREIEVRFEAPEDLPLVLADAGRLEQVYINLLINARDAIEERYSGPDKPSEVKRITLSAKVAGDFLEIRVTDNGGGIKKAVAERIFEPFFTTKSIGKGTGLGLSISYGIIKDCGGEISVEPGEGKGATFIVSLPLAKGEA